MTAKAHLPALAALLATALSPVPALAQDSAQGHAQDTVAHPDLSGFWGAKFKMDDPDPDMVAKLPPDTVVIYDSGVPEFKKGEFGGLKLTPPAQEHADQWNPLDEMTLDKVCIPPSIVYALQGPFPFEIYQTRDLIAFKYEYFDQVRLIFMDGRNHPPADAPHSKMGHSVGHWEGDELVVDTTNIAASTITNNGLDHSDQIHMTERYRLAKDGKELEVMQWFSDPQTLENNGARWMEWEKRPGQYVYPYECDPTFVLDYQQMESQGDGAE